MRDSIASGARELVERIKSKTKLPVAWDWYRHPEQAYEAATMADGVVVGSAIVNAFHHEAHTPEGRARAASG